MVHVQPYIVHLPTPLPSVRFFLFPKLSSAFQFTHDLSQIPKRLFSLLPSGVQESIQCKEKPEDGLSTLVAYLLPRYIFSLPPHYLPILSQTHEKSKQGKPFLRSSKDERSTTHYNLSHDGNYILLGISPQEIGVDVMHYELDYWPDCTTKSLYETLIDHLTKEEKAQYQSLGEEEKGEWLIRVWAVKEALSKWFGLGLKMGLKRFQVSFPLADKGEIEVLVDGQKGWVVKEVDIGQGYFGVVASKSDEEVDMGSVKCWEAVDFLSLCEKAIEPVV